MNDKQVLDNQLAQMTDIILEGGKPSFPSQELENEIQTIRSLKAMIAPEDDVNPVFQQRLTQTLMKEWDNRASRSGKVIQMPFKWGVMQVVAAAAAVAIVFAAVVITASPPTGSAVDDGGVDPFSVLAIMVVVSIVIGLGSGFYYWWNRRS